MASANNTSDFNQWLHAMKMVARLPGGMPPEFRRKLWLALAERHLQTNLINWEKEETRCLSEPSNRDDDEELEVQIVKDLHRTGSSLFSGPSGSVNQAKLKRILVGYARWNPSVGYCQGFNMLGALILQVMDKNEIESLKVMIFLIEGILPSGYFSGSLSGLQTDMAVFRDIMAVRLPKLAKHLQKLQGPIGEGSFEPPLTNVFTMQWFLTLFCTCLPYNCVLRVWDLVLIEGSDILLRTALAIWGLLEKRILQNKTADEFYCNMGMLSGELLNGHLFDSNGLIQKVVELGPIPELQKMRDKHIYNITPWKDKRGLRLFFSDDEGDSDDDSRAALTNAWGIRLGGTSSRRGSLGLGNLSNTTTSSSGSGGNASNIGNTTNTGRPVSMHENRERIALDITLLKKQYDKLRERQRQAHIILTTTARQSVDSATNSTMPVNQYLLGKNAIVNKGRRIGPPAGAIPPVRKPTMKVSPKQHKKTVVSGSGSKTGINNSNASPSLTGTTTKMSKTTTVAVTIPPKDLSSIDKASSSGLVKNATLHKSPSVTSTNSSLSDSSMPTVTSHSRKKSESSSYSDDSDENSSTSTSLCDDDNLEFSTSSIEASPLKKKFTPIDLTPSEQQTASQLDECLYKLRELNVTDSVNLETGDANARDCGSIKKVSDDADDSNKKLCSSIVDESTAVPIKDLEQDKIKICNSKKINNQNTKCIDDNDNLLTIGNSEPDNLSSKDITAPFISVNSIQTVDNVIQSTSITTIIPTKKTPSTDIKKTPELIKTKFQLSPIAITSTSQLSPIADISKYLSNSSISPLRTPASFLDYTNNDGDKAHSGDNCINSNENDNDDEQIYEIPNTKSTTTTPILNKMLTHSTSNTSIKPSILSTSSSAASFKDKSTFQVNEDGVTNEYFERLNAPERPCRLELQHIVLMQQQIGAEEFITSNPVCSTFEQTTKEYTITTEPLDHHRSSAGNNITTITEDSPKAVSGKCIETNVSIDSDIIPDDTLKQLSTSPTMANKNETTSILDTEWNNFHVSDNDDSSEHFYDKYYVNENPAIDDSIGNSPIPTKSSIHSPWSLASISENQLLIIENVPIIISTDNNIVIDNSECQNELLLNKIDDDLVVTISSPPPSTPTKSPTSLPPILSQQNEQNIINDEIDEKNLMLPTDFNSQKRHSNRALQIIEENSLILDKILKKTLTGNKESQSDSLLTPTNLSNDYHELITVCTDESVDNFKDCGFVDRNKSVDDVVDHQDHHNDDDDIHHHNGDGGNEDKYNDKDDDFPIHIDEPSIATSPLILPEILSPPLSLPVTQTQLSSFIRSTEAEDLNNKDSITFSLRSIKNQMNSIIDDEPCCANNSIIPLVSPTKIDLFLNETNYENKNSDITETLKSIKNTIKSVDDACINPSQRKSTFIHDSTIDIEETTSLPSTLTSVSQQDKFDNKSDINKLLKSLNNSIKSVDDKQNAKLIELPIKLDNENLTDTNDISQTLNSIKNTIKSVDDACIDNATTTTIATSSIITKTIMTPNQDEINIEIIDKPKNNNDISETLQSIQNTIKSVDNACFDKTNNESQITLTSSFIETPNQDDLSEQHSETTSGSTTLSTIEDTTSILEYKSTKPGSILFKDSITPNKTCSNDINETIYSIKNTIKSIDTLCKKEKNKFNSNHHQNHRHHHNSSSSSSERIQFQFDSVDYNSSSSSLSSSTKFTTPSGGGGGGGAKDLKYLEFQRNSRDTRREISPRRYRDDDRAEYESRTKRDTSLLSSSTSRLNNFLFDGGGGGGGTTKPKYIHSLPPYASSVIIKKTDGIGDSDIDGKTIGRFDNDDSSIQIYKSHDSNLNLTSKDTAGSRFIKFQPTDKFSIRHTTVTSTFYDRFLSQKMERNVRMDKSPVKITQNYLDSLRLLAPTTHHTSYNRDRPKSAENSPSRSNFDLLSNTDGMLQTATTTTMSVSMSACSKKLNDHHGAAGSIGSNADKRNSPKIMAVSSTTATIMTTSTPTLTTISGDNGTGVTDTITTGKITNLPITTIEDQSSTIKSNS